MKKLLSVLLCLAMLIPAAGVVDISASPVYDEAADERINTSFVDVESETEEWILGDIAKDGKCNALDILYLRLHLSGGKNLELNYLTCDVNADSKSNASDLLAIRLSIAMSKEPDEAFGTIPGHKVYCVLIGDTNIADFSIYTPEDATDNMVFAAQELRDYVEITCGAQLEIIREIPQIRTPLINIVTDTTGELGVEGFCIAVENGDLTITGGTKRGCMYGVYAFIENYLGWRFLTEELNYIYESDAVIVPSDTDDTQIPVFDNRDAQTVSYNINHLPIVTKRNINSWKNRGNLEKNAKYGYSTGYIGGAHSFFDLIRTPVDRNPCFSDEDVFEEIYDAVIAKLDDVSSRGYPIDAITVSQMDNDWYCKCVYCRNTCTQENQSGVIVKFLNKMQTRVNAVYPNTKIWALAYTIARVPPKTLKVNDNIIICYAWNGCNSHDYNATIDVCSGGTLSDKTYPADALSSTMCNPTEQKYLEKWCSIAKDVTLWYYPIAYTFYTAPAPFAYKLLHDLKYIADCGVTAVYMEGWYAYDGDGRGDGQAFEALSTYLETKAMWNPYMPEDEYLTYMSEFLQAYYGDGWEHIREYAEMQTTATSFNCWINQWDWPFDMYDYDYMRDNCLTMIDLMDSALAMTEDEAQKTHIYELSSHIYFLGVSALHESMYENGTPESRAEYEALYDELLRIVKTYNIQIGSIGPGAPDTANYDEVPVKAWYGLARFHRYGTW